MHHQVLLLSLLTVNECLLHHNSFVWMNFALLLPSISLALMLEDRIPYHFLKSHCMEPSKGVFWLLTWGRGDFMVESSCTVQGCALFYMQFLGVTNSHYMVCSAKESNQSQIVIIPSEISVYFIWSSHTKSNFKTS